MLTRWTLSPPSLLCVVDAPSERCDVPRLLLSPPTTKLELPWTKVSGALPLRTPMLTTTTPPVDAAALPSAAGAHALAPSQLELRPSPGGW